MLRHILWKGNTFRNCGVPDPLLVGDPSPHIPQWGFPQSYSYQKWISKCRLGWIRGVCKSNGKIMQLFWSLIHCFRVSLFCYFWSSLSMFLFIFFFLPHFYLCFSKHLRKWLTRQAVLLLTHRLHGTYFSVFQARIFF